MNILIVGAGRMGCRHASGLASSDAVHSIAMIDLSSDSLINANNSLRTVKGIEKIKFHLLDDELSRPFDVIIFASTASNRYETCKKITEIYSPKYVLVEKPLGQSFDEVLKLLDFFSSTNTEAYVNLNMRLYPWVQELKHDLSSFKQFSGSKVISLNCGTLGIGANGIHYLDFLFFITNCERAEIVHAEIEPLLIPSGRGNQYGDYGGWITVRLFDRADRILGRAHLSMTSSSTVFGAWDILGTHGRITIDEISAKRVDHLRSPESKMPINRYATDYMEPVEKKIVSPALGDLTRLWLEALIENKSILPRLSESKKVHRLLFDWLGCSKNQEKKYPIT